MSDNVKGPNPVCSVYVATFAPYKNARFVILVLTRITNSKFAQISSVFVATLQNNSRTLTTADYISTLQLKNERRRCHESNFAYSACFLLQLMLGKALCDKICSRSTCRLPMGKVIAPRGSQIFFSFLATFFPNFQNS